MAAPLHRALVVAALAAGAVVAAPGAAAAQEVEARPVPDYDGRGEEPTTAGDVLLWVPRVIFAPVYFVSEYVVRRPLGAFVSYAELNHWPAILVDFFTFGPDRKAGIVPTALIDFGFRPSVGLYAWGDDFLFDGNDVRVHGATWGKDWLRLSIRNRTALGDDGPWLALRGLGERRSDWVFYGLGWDSREGDFSRFQRTEIGGSVLFEADLWRSSGVVWEVGIRDNDFQDEACCGEPSVPDQVAQGAFDSLPPGWEGYTAVTQRLEVTLDTRRDRPAHGSGVRLQLEGTHGFDTRDLTDRRWVGWGGNLGLYWDPTGLNRVIGLTLTALFTDPLGDAEVPFTEQVTLGGTQYMRGYLEGRLVGRSAAIATLEYRYPVWIWLDGTMHVAAGNVFGEHLEDFAFDRLRLSFGLGLRTVGSRESSFDLLLAFGSEPFDRFEVSSVRFLFGSTYGF